MIKLTKIEYELPFKFIKQKEKWVISYKEDELLISEEQIEKMAFEYFDKLKKNYHSKIGQIAVLPKSNTEFRAIRDGYMDGFKACQKLIKNKLIHEID